MKVAADFARGIERRGHFDPSHSLRQLGRRQRDFDSLGGAQLFFETASFARSASYSRAFSIATAAWLASSVRISTSALLKASSPGFRDRRRRCIGP